MFDVRCSVCLCARNSSSGERRLPACPFRLLAETHFLLGRTRPLACRLRRLAEDHPQIFDFMSETTTTAPPASEPREKLTKRAVTADHPTWCPGCGDFAVLASFYKVLEKRQLEHEKIVTLAGIGCSSRFPYFVNGHGAHFIHGRAVPLAS